MCRFCRHKDLDRVPLIHKYWTPFGGNKKAALKAIAARLHEIKKERKRAQQKGERTPYIDFERDALKFAAWVLNYNYQKNKGWKDGGWMNGLGGCHDKPPGAALFVC